MQQGHPSPQEGPWMARQRRPAAVARFLNKIPLDDRHGATNALLILGLRAYEKTIPNAPANLETLSSVASQPPSTLNETQAGLSPGGTFPSDTSPLSSHTGQQRAIPNSSAKQQQWWPSPQVPQSGAASSSLSLSQSKCRTPALSLVLEDTILRPSSQIEDEERRVRMEGEPNARDQDFSSLDVSEETVCKEHSRAPLPPATPPLRGKMNCQRTSALEVLYPLEFLTHVRRRIEITRGIRENSIAVAASLPQDLAIHTTRESFDDLYRSLLVSYHLTVGVAND